LQVKGIRNRFNKIIAEKIPNVEKEMPIQEQEASRTSNRQDQNRICPQHLVVKTISKANKERILKSITMQNQITYIVNPSK
jgi:hypothetical protein